MVNGCAHDELAVSWLLIGGVTYAPVRAVVEAVGAEVSGWDIERLK
ncbi:hypothetical protein [Paenibacillus popilliae]|nr:hypothetical protein [Paenibacillus popilliae]